MRGSDPENFGWPSKELIFSLLIMGFVVGGFTLFFLSLDHTERDTSQLKHLWFTEHQCKRTGYTDGSPVYTCDDGQPYIWLDIPPPTSRHTVEDRQM